MKDDRARLLDAICDRIRKSTEARIGKPEAFGVDLGCLGDGDRERINGAVLAAIKEATPMPWPDENVVVKCQLDGNILRTRVTMPPGALADYMARAGLDVRRDDGTPYVPMGEEFTITVRETKV